MKEVALEEWVKLWKWEMEMNWEHPETEILVREGTVEWFPSTFLWFCRLEVLPFVLAT